ncbi:trigger factor [Candidatus Berkelbacteria bacterium]|nr:trigger factor [Candidatus Berkelbacteria bacterium]
MENKSSSVAVKDHKKHKHSRHEFVVEVAAPKMAEYFDIAYKQLAPSVEIKGFRPGQAPKMMTIQKIGQARYAQQALDIALPNSYAEAMKSLGLQPIAPPKVSVQSYGEGAPLTYKIEVDVLPEVKPGDYQKIKVKAPKVDTKVEAKEVDEVIERLRKQQASAKDVDRPAKKGDKVDIDYEGLVDNVKRDDLSSQHFPVIIGDEAISKKIEESLIGKKKGDSYEVQDKIDKDSVNFKIAVHGVAEVELPEIDKVFAEKFGRKDADDLKASIKEQLELEKANEGRRKLEADVLEAVMKKAEVELPRSLVDEEISRRLGHMKNQLGVMFNKFLEQQKLTEEKLRKDLEKPAEESVKSGLVLGEIAKKEGFGKDRPEGESDDEFQRRVVQRTINFLVASATGQKVDEK